MVSFIQNTLYSHSVCTPLFCPETTHSIITQFVSIHAYMTACVYRCMWKRQVCVCVCVLYIKSGTMGIWLQVQLKPWTNQLNYPWQLVHHLITGSANIYISNELQPKWNIFFHKNYSKMHQINITAINGFNQFLLTSLIQINFRRKNTFCMSLTCQTWPLCKNNND